MIKSKKINWLRSQKAQTLVEFALVFPVLLVITYGIIEFGRMLFIYTEVTSAAREGSRYGAAASTYKDCTGIRNAAMSQLLLIPKSSVAVDIQYTHYPTPPTCVVNYSGANLVLGDRVVVTVTAQFSTIIPLPGLPNSPISIVRKSTRTLLMGIDIKP